MCVTCRLHYVMYFNFSNKSHQILLDRIITCCMYYNNEIDEDYNLIKYVVIGKVYKFLLSLWYYNNNNVTEDVKKEITFNTFPVYRKCGLFYFMLIKIIRSNPIRQNVIITFYVVWFHSVKVVGKTLVIY